MEMLFKSFTSIALHGYGCLLRKSGTFCLFRTEAQILGKKRLTWRVEYYKKDKGKQGAYPAQDLQTQHPSHSSSLMLPTLPLPLLLNLEFPSILPSFVTKAELQRV
jgi:hypothetical protein